MTYGLLAMTGLPCIIQVDCQLITAWPHTPHNAASSLLHTTHPGCNKAQLAGQAVASRHCFCLLGVGLSMRAACLLAEEPQASWTCQHTTVNSYIGCNRKAAQPIMAAAQASPHLHPALDDINGVDAHPGQCTSQTPSQELNHWFGGTRVLLLLLLLKGVL